MNSMTFANLLANATPSAEGSDAMTLWANVAYLVAAVLFIMGLKGLTHPRTAVRGNFLGALGMLLAVVVTVVILHGQNTPLIFGVVLGGIALGAIVGGFLALRIQMTAMPQLVAVFNGFGGIASVLVAGAAVLDDQFPSIQDLVAAAASGLIGGVTFTGSLIAFAKLQEIQAFRKPWSFPGQQAANALLAAATIGLSAWLVMMATGENADPQNYIWLYVAVSLLACVLGVTLTMSIGGADMPVVIALLNSYSGIAAAATGFVINNNVLIVAGSLVGASGVILTKIMCKAMNRSLVNVLFGTMGPGGSSPGSDDEIYAGKIKSTSADEIAMMLDGAQRVVIVPGYGLAVAQAQHAVRELATQLEKRGVEVEFAIHPVAGRMPGHMNVLLAEAEVPYDKLKEMDEINPTFPQTDVVIVIGANDVVNPLARTDPNSPIAGMPILDVDKARTVVVVKRSLSPGFAGIPNPLFAADNCLMYFADGKQAVLDMVAAVKEN
jgi:NAD(P) transhydrogenase subunit beta